MRGYWRHTAAHPWLFGVAAICIVVSQATYVIGPIYLKNFIDIVGGAMPSPASAALAVVPLALYALAGFVGWAFDRLQFFVQSRISTIVARDLTNEAFEYLMRHSASFFSSSFAGALTRRLTRYRDAYYNIYSSLLNSIVPAALFIAGATAVLLARNVVLGGILFVWVVVFIFIQWALVRWQQPLRLRRSEADSAVTAALSDAISNHPTVQLFASNRHEEGVVADASENLRLVSLRVWRFDIWFYGVQGLLAIGANVGLLWASLSYWQQGLLTVGDLVLIQSYVFGILHNTWGIGREFRGIFSNLADAAEMATILETSHSVKDKSDARHLVIHTGGVWFDDVSFRFHKQSPVLRQFNLTIAGGERVALVGPSGAGKSTVIKLLLRLYDVDGGEIKIDSQNIADVTQDSLRDAISFVPQEPVLFHRTIMENIRYGWRDASDEQVIEAAKQAHCHEFIEKLPQGYNTYVGERGIKLSGGERQRVAIARAILKDAPVLVLDEATSSLDSESEALIQDALETLMQNKTVIVIAHRLSTIMKMDRIVVMEQGRIVAQGSHLQLIKERGLYQKLWSIQAGGFIGSAHEAGENSGEASELEGPEPRVKKKQARPNKSEEKLAKTRREE